jgi:hypothetical protein
MNSIHQMAHQRSSLSHVAQQHTFSNDTVTKRLRHHPTSPLVHLKASRTPKHMMADRALDAALAASIFMLTPPMRISVGGRS